MGKSEHAQQATFERESGEIDNAMRNEKHLKDRERGEARRRCVEPLRVAHAHVPLPLRFCPQTGVKGALLCVVGDVWLCVSVMFNA